MDLGKDRNWCEFIYWVILQRQVKLTLAYLHKIAIKPQRRLFYGPVKIFFVVVEFPSSGSKWMGRVLPGWRGKWLITEGERMLWVWRWEQYFLPKLWYIFARLYGVTA